MSSMIIPTMRYRDAGRMIDWLCSAFGFEPHLVIQDDADGIAHAQLTFGNAMIMLGTARNDEFGTIMKTAEALGGVSQSPYILADDVDAVCERAEAAGAEILIRPRDESYGGRGFTCRDPEGQIWNFGSYDPWKKH